MIRALLPRRWRDVGKRGQILLIFGFIWTIIGVSVFQNPTLPGYEHLIFSHIPTWLRAAGWICTGLLAIAYALRPKWIANDAIGFVALYLMPAERAAIFLWGYVQYLIPGDSPGYGRGLFAAAVYFVLVAAVMVTASWPEPPRDAIPEADT